MDNITQSADGKPETPMAVTRTYSLTMLHIGKVSDMAQRLGISQGDVVRRAIDLLWKEVTPTPES